MQSEIEKLKNEIQLEERKFRIELHVSERFQVLKSIRFKLNKLTHQLAILEGKHFDKDLTFM